MKLTKIPQLGFLVAAMVVASSAHASKDVYADYPVTLQGYTGDKQTSVS